MNHPTDDGRSPKPRLLARVGGWALILLAIPLFVLGVSAFMGMTGNAVAYLAGFGEEVTVTVTKSSRGLSKSEQGSSEAGAGYFTQDGDRIEVEIWGVEKGQRVEARLPVMSTEGDPGRAYVGFSPAFWDAVYGLIFTAAGSIGGWLAIRGGRAVKSGRY